MNRLTAYVSGRVQRVGYRAKVVSFAHEMNLVGLVQKRPDEIGERLDEGIEELKELVANLNNSIARTKDEIDSMMDKHGRP